MSKHEENQRRNPPIGRTAKLNTAVMDAIKAQAKQATLSGTLQACCVMPDELNPSADLFTTIEPFAPDPSDGQRIAKQAALPDNPRLAALKPFGIRTMLDAALRYAYHGIKVFPLVAGGKTPHGNTSGYKSGTTDPLQIINWWTKNPDCNIGIVTGATEQANYECAPGERPYFMQRAHKPYHLFVLDVDTKGDKNGWAVIDALTAQYGALPATVVQDTPTGGTHLLYKVPVDAGLKCHANIFKEHGEGLDTRCAGGYIVAAPSITAASAKTVDGMYNMRGFDAGGAASVYADEGDITDSPGLLYFFRTTDEIAELPAAWVAALQNLEKRSSTGTVLGKTKTDTTVTVDADETLSEQDREELELACEYINLDDRGDWIAAMLGLMPYGGVGLQLWIKASRKGKYANESDAEYEAKWAAESDTDSNSDKGIVHSIVNRQLKAQATLGDAAKQAAYKAAMQAIKDKYKKPDPWAGNALNLPTADIGIGAGAQTSVASWIDTDLTLAHPVPPTMPSTCTSVAVAALLRSYSCTIVHNVMRDKVGVHGLPKRFTTLDLCVQAVKELALHHGVNWHAEGIRTALELAATSTEYHPAYEWVKSIPWDGVDRFDDLLRTITTTDDDYAAMWRIGFKRWCMGAVRCLVHPQGMTGVPSIVFYEPKGGMGKDRWTSKLCPSEYIATPTGFDPENKDWLLTALGGWVGVFPEVATQTTKGGVNRVKDFLTRSKDTYTPKYKMDVTERPRRTVYIASTNEVDYLADRTGSNRRFITIATQSINHTHDIDMQQFWAQMLHVFMTAWESNDEATHRYWLEGEESELQERINRTHVVNDPLADTIEALWDFNNAEWLDDKSNNRFAVPVQEVRNALDPLQMEKHGILYEKRIARELTRLGVAPTKAVSLAGKKTRCYLMPPRKPKA